MILDDVMREEVLIRQNKNIRGYIIRSLVMGANNCLALRSLINAMVGSGIIVSPDINKHVDYLVEAGYVTFTDKTINSFNAYRRDGVLRLTKKGVDLVEGNIDSDPGVDV